MVKISIINFLIKFVCHFILSYICLKIIFMENYQGKRKDQVESSEKMVAYSIAGIAIVLSLYSIYHFFKTLING